MSSENTGFPLQESINRTLKDYVRETSDWVHTTLVQQLHDWVARFDTEFHLGLDIPAIQIERVNVRKLGTYHRNRNGLGLRHQLTLNTKHLDRSPAQILETLFHELLHEWQELHGTSGARNYHNCQFRDKAHSYGLVVNARGYSLGVEPGLFTQLLARHGIDLSTLTPPRGTGVPTPPTTSGAYWANSSKLKKWSCGCTNIRAAVVVHAQCLQCGRPFQPAPAAW